MRGRLLSFCSGRGEAEGWLRGADAYEARMARVRFEGRVRLCSGSGGACGGIGADASVFRPSVRTGDAWTFVDLLFSGSGCSIRARRARRSDCSPLACVGRWGGRVAGPTARITVRGAFGSLRSQVGSRWLTGDRRAGYCGNVCWLRVFSRSFPLSGPVRTCPEDRYEPVMSCGRWLRMREGGGFRHGRTTCAPSPYRRRICAAIGMRGWS